MPRSGPEGVSPEEIFPFPVGQTPPDDRAYFAMLTWFVFGSGLNWKVMRAKWPHFQRVFHDFDVARVAAFREADIDRLLADAGIVRNAKKIAGTVENARAIAAIAGEWGDLTGWLRSFGPDGEALIAAVKRRLHHMGDVTSRMFLTAAGAIEYQTWQPTERQRRGTR